MHNSNKMFWFSPLRLKMKIIVSTWVKNQKEIWKLKKIAIKLHGTFSDNFIHQLPTVFPNCTLHKRDSRFIYIDLIFFTTAVFVWTAAYLDLAEVEVARVVVVAVGSSPGPLESVEVEEHVVTWGQPMSDPRTLGHRSLQHHSGEIQRHTKIEEWFLKLCELFTSQ
jgi:hypothetical protein